MNVGSASIQRWTFLELDFRRSIVAARALRRSQLSRGYVPVYPLPSRAVLKFPGVFAPTAFSSLGIENPRNLAFQFPDLSDALNNIFGKMS